ncbi:reverse transcriptase domain-containing protein [Tanacetum coccineum]
MAPKRATRSTPVTENPTTTTVTNAQLQAMIDQGVTAALAARDANRNGNDSHTSGTGAGRTERVARECTYQDFMKCQPLYFKGTEGVVELTQWFERMETVFRISNCSVENQIKFSTCTLLAGALTWWNSHVRIVGYDVAYAMTWTDLRKKMTDKYCPRNEMKKLEAELWNFKVKELMDKKISTFAERQAENKRKLDNNRQAQQHMKLHIHFVPCDFQEMMTTVNQGMSVESDCPERKNQNHENQRGAVHALRGGETDQDPNNIKDEIKA